MRVVITGSQGQVAQSLAERCAGSANIELVHAARPDFDLGKPEALAEAIAGIEPDVVINAAAYTAVDQAENEPDRAMTINAVSAGAVALGAQKAGAPVIQISTDYVFDGTLDRPYREDDPVAPLGVYGRTKLAGEKAVAAANSRHFILRTAWIYSPFGNNFVKTMLRLAQTRDEISVVDDQIGNPTSALDLADGILAAVRTIMDSGALPSPGIYHLAGTGEASWFGLSREIFKVAAPVTGRNPEVRPITTAQYPTPAARPANSTLDSGKFSAAFGFRAPDWRKSVRECVERLVRTEDAAP